MGGGIAGSAANTIQQHSRAPASTEKMSYKNHYVQFGGNNSYGGPASSAQNSDIYNPNDPEFKERRIEFELLLD